MSNPLFFHVDLDAFFASVEILDNPDLKGKPLIIGHKGPRSVVSTCSYEARCYGVHSAMPMVTALRLCPNAICIGGNHKRYSEKSKEVMDILRSYAPDIIQTSIDEAFLDMSGTERIYGSPGKSAHRLQDTVYEQTGLTVSIGIASSRYIAKLASDYHKPKGVTYIPDGREQEFIDLIGIEKLWGIGKATHENFKKHHIYDVQTLRAFSEEGLTKLFGDAQGAYIYKIVRGIDPGIYTGEAKSHSISSERTFFPDLLGEEAINQFLYELASEIMFRAHDEGFSPKTIGVKIRYSDFSTHTAAFTPGVGIYNSKDVYHYLKDLFWSKYKGGGIRLLGAGLYNLFEGDSPEQLELFVEDKVKMQGLEKTILNLSKSGLEVKRASQIKKTTKK